MATSPMGMGYALGHGTVKNKKKKPDPWGGAAHGTSMGAGSTAALTNLQHLYGPSPTSPTPPADTPPPVDSVYQNQLGINQQTYDLGFAGLEGQKTSVLGQYGYQAQFDPTTHQMVAGSLKMDPNNPYSRAAQLQKSYTDGKRASLGQAAARGHLYSSGYKQTGDYADGQYNTNRSGMEGELGQVLAGIAGQETQLGIDLETGNNIAKGESIARIPDNPLDTSGTLPSSGSSKSGAPKRPYDVMLGKNARGQSGAWHLYPGGRKVFVVGGTA